MHVPSYPRVVALVLMLAGIAGSAQAVEFDEKLKAPLMRDPVVLRSQAESYVSKFAALQAAGPRERISNRALAAQRFDLTWQIQQAIDTGKPLGDMSALGLVARGDGSYKVDYDASPQWERPEQVLAAWLPATNWEVFGEQLVERGFRREDVTKLREFVNANNFEQKSRREALPLAISFSKVVKKYDKIKRPVDDAAVLAYIYQRDRNTAEKNREWAEALLDSLDAQRARILLGYFDEMHSSGVWAPSDQRVGIDEQLRLMRLPNYEQLATAAATGVTP
jgi:hypothetical protein